jgi:hypothetical protein
VDWELDDDGTVVVHPVCGYQIAEVRESALLARIEYLSFGKDGTETRAAIQLLLDPHVALELSELLAEKAQHIASLQLTTSTV